MSETPNVGSPSDGWMLTRTAARNGAQREYTKCHNNQEAVV
jgi:hypothetical protein